MAFVLPFLPMIGMAAGAGGAVLSGVSAADAASYQATVASNNAKTERQNAQHAAAVTAVQTEDAGLKARAQNAGVRAALAANNVDISSGSAADVQQSEHKLGLLDTQTVANKGAEQVYGYQIQSAADQAQSRLDQSQVNSDIFGGVLSAAGMFGKNASLLSGPPSVPSGYDWMTSPGEAASGAQGAWG